MRLNDLWICRGLALFGLCGTMLAQNGDKEGEAQAALDPTLQIPDAPVVSPEAALALFQLDDGLEIQLVASEPLIHDPVEIEFDAWGRIWVVEMRGYMPNADGVGEDIPNGRVVVLEDTDHDGRMDQSTVFVDGLQMPRAIGLAHDGLLVAEPPNLWFYRDTDGDLVSDEKTLVADDYGSQQNPEHTSNGLLWAMDNWIYSANHTTRFRNLNGSWEREPTVFRGQWGLAQDDWGRLFYDTNSDQLRGDLLPAEYLRRNPNYPNAQGANVRIAADQTVWPSRVTPGINRGYRPGMLKDGKLTRFTAACGPVIYRGDNLPAEYHGNAFVAEPSGNLIKRNLLVEDDGVVTAKNAYEGREFLTSNDERFRPVNLNNGPDGALYIVDFYRGIIQHRIYMTSFLREQVDDRQLATPVGLGRIYRVVTQGTQPTSHPPIGQMSPAELVLELEHANGWRRSTAQRLLVEQRATQVTPFLRALAADSAHPKTRLHALWTLDGLGAIDIATVRDALEDSHPKVQRTALRLAERFFNTPDGWELLPVLRQMVNQAAPEVALQLALSLGELDAGSAQTALQYIVDQYDHPLMRDAVLSSLGDREFDFLNSLLASGQDGAPSEGETNLAQTLSRVVFSTKQAPAVARLLGLAAAEHASPFKIAILDGILSTKPKPSRGRPAPKIKPVSLSEKPKAFDALQSSSDPDVRTRVNELSELIQWSDADSANPGAGTSGNASDNGARPLTADEQKLFDLGKALYAATCAACHQPHGNGQPGLAPPLRDSEWIESPDERLVRIVLHGINGPIEVNGEEYNLAMPGLPVFSDEQIAALLTYTRREWNHTGDPIGPEVVAKVRSQHEGRFDMWTVEELLDVEDATP